ncbi:MAG TPA: hypothetical protein VHZ73_00635 [Vicinamibacterales bacterium]|jgi:hypothetical protein|nr:hypothetical protein [Vicinamibacterales bacterium]
MILLVSAAIVAAAVIGAAVMIARELRTARDRATNTQALDLIAVFAPGVAAAALDPQAYLGWQPLAETARSLAPDAFRALDRAAGGAFPFSKGQLEAAHARWTADWLAWEYTHDVEFKLKAAAAVAELTASGGTPEARARVDAVEREKLDLYQRRYTEYVRVAKSLQALIH